MSINIFKKHFAEKLAQHLPLELKEIIRLIEYPPEQIKGDLGIPCFSFAKAMRKSPVAIADEIAKSMEGDELLGSVFSVGPYVNTLLNRKGLAKEVISSVLANPSEYGRHEPCGKTAVMDFSSPNIAKPFHIGHLRSTVIGNSIRHILKHMGWNVVAINHLGDWGTQFGKLIVAFKNWGDEEKLTGKEPIKYLEELYVKFHDELKSNPSLDEEARAAFKSLEEGSEESLKLWKRFRDISLKKFYEIYDYLNIDFDYNTGESFYNDRTEATIKRLEEAGLTEISDGALIIKLDEYNLPVCLLKKTDGATLYATRDLAAAFYRKEEFKPDRLIYVTGAPQRIHFMQFFKVLELVDKDFEGKTSFVGFGQIRFGDQKLSTRKGNVIYLEDLITNGNDLALKKLNETEASGRDIEDSKAIAKAVTLAGLIFGDLSTDRVKDIDFEWDRMLEFRGDTGPCVQYARARAMSLIKKSNETPTATANLALLSDDDEAQMLITIGRLPEVIEEAGRTEKPHVLAQHILQIAREWNSYYHSHERILLLEPELKAARLALAGTVAGSLELGLSLLGIPVPDSM
jgi:arginyl-tRNA synthetase